MHDYFDAINGLFEAIGALATWNNVLAIRRDRTVRGVAWGSMAFFALWGTWNLVFYPHLHQWLSTLGGAFLVAGNLTWVGLALKYKARKLAHDARRRLKFRLRSQRRREPHIFELKAEGNWERAPIPKSGIVLRVDERVPSGGTTGGPPPTTQCGPADSSMKFISR